jgi:hypothetical protein
MRNVRDIRTLDLAGLVGQVLCLKAATSTDKV